MLLFKYPFSRCKEREKRLLLLLPFASMWHNPARSYVGIVQERRAVELALTARHYVFRRLATGGISAEKNCRIDQWERIRVAEEED